MLTYYDYTTSGSCGSGALYASNTCFAQFKNTPRWLTDIEIGYRVNRHLHLAVGANNVFNIRPRRLPTENDSNGVNLYDQNSSQVPIMGGYYYGRINATF